MREEETFVWSLKCLTRIIPKSRLSGTAIENSGEQMSFFDAARRFWIDSGRYAASLNEGGAR
jgi:hypothetical protein